MSTVTRYRHTFLSAAKTALQIKIAHPTPLSFASFGTSGLNYSYSLEANSPKGYECLVDELTPENARNNAYICSKNDEFEWKISESAKFL